MIRRPRPPSHASHSTRRQRYGQGFTMIEVMAAATILAGGLFTMLALLARATTANVAGREMGTATMTNAMWHERLRRDALSWTEATTGASMTNTRYLRGLDAVTNTTGWFVPVDPTNAGIEFPALSYAGEEVEITSEDVHYCTMVNLNWISAGQTVRIDVLTWWHRDGRSGDNWVDRALYANCGSGDPEAVVTEIQAGSGGVRHVRGVFTSSIVRRHDLPRGN